MSLAFAEILEEVHLLPDEEKIELRDAIDHDLVEGNRDRFNRSHAETLAEWERGELTPTSDINELLRRLNS